MKIVFLLTVFWIQTYIVTGAIPNCCTSKNVGGLEYNLLRVEDTSQYNCLTNCVYEKIGKPGLAYCFGTGDLKVECKGEGDPIICDDELKTLHGLLSASNNTNDIHCCENAMTINKTTCGNGTDCATVCGVIPTCAKVVTDPEEGKDHCSNSKTNTRDGRANNYYQMVIMKISETIGPENLGSGPQENLNCDKDVTVTGDMFVYPYDCPLPNQQCTPVKNILTHSDDELCDGLYVYAENNGPATYWTGPSGNDANFILDLGCKQTFDTIQLVNTHNSYHRDRATKLFNLYVGQTNTGPWTLVLVALLYDSRNDLDPLPVQCIPLQTGEETAQFILFELITTWGEGGGLQFFDIVRKSDANQCVATHLNQNKGTTGTTGTGKTDDRIICDENLTKLHELLLDANNTIEVRCCANGYTNKTVSCGNGTDCPSVCGDTPTCAKMVVNEPKEGKNYCESKDQNNQDIHTLFIGTVPDCDAAAKVNCNDVSEGTKLPPKTNTYCNHPIDITIPKTDYVLVEDFDFTETCRNCDPACRHCSNLCPIYPVYNDKIAEFINNP